MGNELDLNKEGEKKSLKKLRDHRRKRYSNEENVLFH